MKREYSYSASLEFDEAAPETVRGTLVAATPQRAAYQTTRRLLEAHPRRRWRSFVVVITKPGVLEGQADA